jgi:hypothetical protein
MALKAVLEKEEDLRSFLGMPLPVGPRLAPSDAPAGFRLPPGA